MISTSEIADQPASASTTDKAALILDAVSKAPREQLEALRKAMYADWGAGLLTDADAGLVEAKIIARLRSKFEPRRHRASNDRVASRHRRRRLGGSSALPDTLRHHYTEGERAVLCVVAGEVKARGLCDLCIDQIAAFAGVSRTTVQNALRMAKKLKHVSVTERPVKGRKNLPNVIHVVSSEWLMWIKRGPSAHRAIGFKGSNCLRPTKSQMKKEEALRDERAPFGSVEHGVRRPMNGDAPPNGLRVERAAA